MFVDIISHGSGNIGSIQNWLRYGGVYSRIVEKASQMQSDLVILPGMGSVGHLMKMLKSNNFDEGLKVHLSNGGRVLGICAGFQALGKSSDEDGGVDCLNFLDFETVRLPGKINHNGWEKFQFEKKIMKNMTLWRGRPGHRKIKISGRVFYNHEYGIRLGGKKYVSLPISQKLPDYAGLVISEQIMGIQFHPEKSQNTGVELLNMVM